MSNFILKKYVQWEPSCSMRTDGQEEATSRFSQISKSAKNRHVRSHPEIFISVRFVNILKKILFVFPSHFLLGNRNGIFPKFHMHFHLTTVGHDSAVGTAHAYQHFRATSSIFKSEDGSCMFL